MLRGTLAIMQPRGDAPFSLASIKDKSVSRSDHQDKVHVFARSLHIYAPPVYQTKPWLRAMANSWIREPIENTPGVRIHWQSDDVRPDRTCHIKPIGAQSRGQCVCLPLQSPADMICQPRKRQLVAAR